MGSFYLCRFSILCYDADRTQLYCALTGTPGTRDRCSAFCNFVSKNSAIILAIPRLIMDSVSVFSWLMSRWHWGGARLRFSSDMRLQNIRRN